MGQLIFLNPSCSHFSVQLLKTPLPRQNYVSYPGRCKLLHKWRIRLLVRAIPSSTELEMNRF